MKTLFLSLILLSVACGQQPSSDKKETTPDANGGIDYPPEEKEVVTEYKKVGDNYALVLEKTKELPECALANDQQLAYITSEKKFFSCNVDTWQEIDVTGPIGPIGPQGPKGDTEVLSQNMWVDPVAHHVWLIGADVTYAQAQSACTDDYRLPTYDELHAAALHGLGVASASIDGSDNAWTTEQLPTNVNAMRVVNFKPLNDAYYVLSELHGVMCIRKE
jgi:hypothetical protein